MRLITTLSILLFTLTSAAQFNTDAPWMESFTDSNRVKEPTFQEIVNAFDAYWANKDETVKGSGYKPFKRWESLYQNYLNPDGRVMTRTQLWDAWQAARANRSTNTDNSNWINIGPVTHTNTGSWSSGQGRVNAMAVDPNNASIYYVGTPAGGIWKSTDAGASWSPLSDQLPQIGVSGIAIDPTNSDIIYIATGDDDAGDSYSVGVLKSMDGGLSWNTTGLNEGNSPNRMNELIIDPDDTQTLWVATTNGVFKTINGGNSWNNVRSGNFDDLEMKPGDTSTLYAATNNTVYKSEDAGENWSNVTSGVFSGTGRIELGVTPANAEVLYVFTSAQSYSTGNIYKSSDAGASFTETFSGGQDIFEVAQAWYDFAFAVSDTDENEIYTGILNIWKSSNSGANFTKVNNWSSPGSASYTHADIHNLRFINGKLFCGSDGGIYTSDDGGTNFTSLTDGLAIGQFYRIDVAKEDPSLVVGGLQDNGGYARRNGEWQNYYGADGMEAAFHPSDAQNIFGFIQLGGGPYFSTTGGASLGGSYGNPEGGNWITPLAFAADEKLYAGYSSLYELDLCSGSWIAKSSSFGQNIDYITTDPNNASIMYVAVNRQLFRSSDSGTTFNQIDTLPSDITSIEVKNGDSTTIYVVTSGTGGRVYKGSIAGNDFTREDITGSLPSIPKLVIKHQAYHPDSPLFLGTAIGVWRYDDVTGDWEDFQNNLPNTAIRDLDINEGSGILTAGTYGRGIWQTDIDKGISTDVSANLASAESSSIFSCGETPVTVNLKNNGNAALTTATFNYSAGGLSNSFAWTGNVNPGEETTVELPVLGLSVGVYDYAATVEVSGDQIPDNNVVTVDLVVNSQGTLTETNLFEETTSELLILPLSEEGDCGEITENTWERGTPSGAVLNQTASGTNAYATNLDGDYGNNTKEFLTTGCYDLTNVNDPFISFQMAFDLEQNWDILYVEFSIDQGDSWNVLGTADDPNWYNSDRLPGNDCQNCPGAQWTGTSAAITAYSYDLSPFSSETTMMFRFVFHSDQSVTEEGAVIDDLLVGGETLSIDEETITGIQIYPNPSNGIFTLYNPNGALLEYSIFDILGKEVLHYRGSGEAVNEHMINMKSFASGMYLLKINQDNKQLVKKLILN